MHRGVIPMLAALGMIAASALPASAQYYVGPGYGGYGPHHGYWRHHARDYGYGGGGYMRPRFDPRNGGTFCADPRFTVQSGGCKPYRGY